MEQQKKISRRIKPIVLVLAILLLVIVTVPAVLIYFWFHPKTRNVFDQLYYEVRAVEWRRDSVLISGTESAFAHYDFGSLMGICISELHPELHVHLAISGNTLEIEFYNFDPDPDADRRIILYRYDVKEKTLYGERPLDYLTDNFLNDYFTWYSNAGNSNSYSQEELGEYEFALRENAYDD